MSVLTPVTNSAIVIDSWSTRKATGMWSPPTGIQSKSVCTKTRSWGLLRYSPAHTTAATAKEPATSVVANHPARGSPRRRPTRSRRPNPSNGRAGRSQTMSSMESASALQQRDVVGGGARPAPEDGDDDAEADHHLGRGHDEHEEHDHLATDVVEHPGEGDEREIDGVEHELHAHEHHQHVAAHEQADGPDYEQECRQREIPGPRDCHGSSVTVSARRSELNGRRARTTAPTTAITSSTDVASNGSR